MVNRYPAAGGQVPKQMQEKLSFMPYDLLVGVCLSKWRDWIFSWASDFFRRLNFNWQLFWKR